MSQNDVVLEVQGLCFAFPQGTEVFSQWSAALSAGLALVQGDESSGKTTLLRLLAGELSAQAGRILLQGVDPREAAAAYAQRVFWADPRSGNLDALTARGWLGGLPARYPHWDASALAAHAEGFTLQEHLDKPFYALSTGARRKVVMAGALASGAPLTLIDEPVSGLDKPSVACLARALAAVAAQPGRLVVVAHFEALPGVPWGRVVKLGS